MQITLQQDGSTITGTDSSGNIRINGRREGSVVRFYIIRGNEINGTWEIGADAGRLEGKWHTNGGGGASGKWNLLRTGQHRAQRYAGEGVATGNRSSSPAKPAVDSAEPASESGKVDLSGTYISEITNNHHWYFTRRYRNLILKVEQRGDRISATDSAGMFRFTGTVDGEKVRFEVFGDGSVTYPFGNKVYGEWMVGNGERLEGSWWAAGHNAGGEWNIRRVGNEKIELFTIETGLERPFSLDRSDELFDMLFQTRDNRSIVFYIHGRGQNFESNFAPGMIPSVESYSDTVFVMVRWLSWGDSSVRPYQHAINSADGVSRLLRDLDAYLSRNPGPGKDRNITLMAHSMGNIPIKIFLQEFYEPGQLSNSLFDSVVLHSADVPWDAHREWVEKVDFADKVYILQHRGDLVLGVSNMFFRKVGEKPGPRLGTGVGADFHADDLAGNARYLDLTRFSNSVHRHFNSPSTPEAARLFKLLLNGEEFDHSDPGIGLIKRTGQDRVLVFDSGHHGSESRR